MPYLTRDTARLYYEECGEGLPILLSHGFGASTGMWWGQVDAFSDRYRLICWDMRGHGQTECPDNLSQYSHAHCVEDMRCLLDHLKIDQAVIGGHSLGGFMSLAFHVSHPERVKALILQGCGPGFRRAEARITWNEYVEERARTLENEGLAALGGGSEVALSAQQSARGLALAARGILSQLDTRVIDSLPDIAVPVLIVIGDGDTNFLNGSAYMAERIAGAVNVVVPGAGHGVNIDQPEAVNEAFAHFLSRL